VSTGFAKTTPPRLNGTYSRARLFRILDRSRKHPATWVCGPPGAGKTTLVASYIRARRVQCLWYHLDEGDNDVAAFFEYIYSAASLGSYSLSPFNPECLQDIATFSRKFFRDFYGRLKTSFTVVFGNYHKAPAGSLLHEVIREAVEEVPRGGHVIFTSRTSPPPQLARLRTNQMMTVVDESELRLTLSEAQGLVCSVLRKSLPKKMIAQIHNIVDGWAAGHERFCACRSPSEHHVPVLYTNDHGERQLDGHNR
jgi:ATP/maltotriose-dependent transcriptional regulator MalT